MNKQFSGKVALVTGAASGMGLAATHAFAAEGASIIMMDWDEKAVERAAEDVRKHGTKVQSIKCDVANEDEVRVAFETVIPQFGRLDAAFNNAGVQSPPTEVADVSGEEYDRVLAINLKGIFNCMKYELQQMRKQGSGAIVNNSSLGGIVGLPYRAIYHASKHGILGLTKSAALEYADRGIRINAVCPGIIHTPMVQKMLETQPDAMDGMIATLPIKRLGTAEEIASAVIWLCGPGSTYVIGQSIVVDGGYTIQ